MGVRALGGVFVLAIPVGSAVVGVGGFVGLGVGIPPRRTQAKWWGQSTRLWTGASGTSYLHRWPQSKRIMTPNLP